MGVNLGDVIAENGTIHGDGVNIASRLEKLAEPGSVCIGRNVYDQVKGRLDYWYSDLGEQCVHNIPEPVHAYRAERSKPTANSSPSALTKESSPLPEKPSIAVLPFDNISGDPKQKYFADGMVEEIITALSRFRQLLIIARTSSFSYKGRAVDVKQIGRELGVRYVLEGSVRKAGRRVRISGQLVETLTGTHLWADRFEGTLDSIFDLQDQITERVVGAIAPKLEQAEIERARRKPTENLGAYDCYLRGLAAYWRFNRGDNSEALKHFRQAFKLDSNFAAAYAMAARCYDPSWHEWVVTDPAQNIAEAAQLAGQAVELGRDDAVALYMAGFALATVLNELEDGDALIDRALALNPILAMAWTCSGWVKMLLGHPDLAIERLSHAMRLSPHDPYLFGTQTAMASAHFAAGNYEEALSWAEMAIRLKPNYLLANCVAAASGALSGRTAAARKALVLVRRYDPQLRLSNLKRLLSDLRPAEFAKWAEGLRKAGLPE
jgi:adenylate cyclase